MGLNKDLCEIYGFRFTMCLRNAATMLFSSESWNLTMEYIFSRPDVTNNVMYIKNLQKYI